jgi:CRP-like cAMP-binding protein
VLFDTARFDTLRRLPFFGGFADTQLWETIHLSNWLDFRDGDTIFEEGSAGDSVYLIASGEIVVSRNGATLNRLGEGECIGEIAFLDEQAAVRSATVRALSPLVLIELSAVGLRNASAELKAAFGRAFIRILLDRIRHADARFLELAQKGGG